MPFKQGDRLPGERASKLGHLEVLKSELVNKLIKEFEQNSPPSCSCSSYWEAIPQNDSPLTIIFGIDGSLQIIESKVFPFKRLAFVKTALLRIDQWALSKINKESPHPLALRDILSNSAIYHATVFPLKHISITGLNTYHAIRRIIYESIKDNSLNNEPMETLKWIAYEKWDGKAKNIPLFECPHCEKEEATLVYDSEIGNCPRCKGELFITDMLGFHQDMAPEFASDSVATSYMQIHEVLLLFTGIRYYWEKNKDILNRCLFVKDGPLSIRAQYSKLVNPIRRFLAFARDKGQPVYLIGQEKSGRFHDHLELIGREAPTDHLFIPGDKYIKEEIQHRPNTGAPYGKDTNYGAKVFFKISQFHQMVLNIPTGEFVSNPVTSNLIGINKISSTLRTILSNRFEGALLPVELANGIASLSTYPSSHILKIFTEARGL